MKIQIVWYFTFHRIAFVIGFLYCSIFCFFFSMPFGIELSGLYPKTPCPSLSKFFLLWFDFCVFYFYGITYCMEKQRIIVDSIRYHLYLHRHRNRHHQHSRLVMCHHHQHWIVCHAFFFDMNCTARMKKTQSWNKKFYSYEKFLFTASNFFCRALLLRRNQWKSKYSNWR